ncbi:MFS transporter [Mangrovibacterium lignilyticum]|uniref:MFS transporter n=1 Tax=Mangrovibacterium lignilyticum TaxID=2668052 RepID=UPI0013D6F7DC|nr:MFS transporter [Mangrovibacterium lignilyticum]
MPVNSSKVINAWCSYDIANSAYNLSIATVLYPIFYQEVTKQAFGSEMVNFLGITIKNTVLYEYAIAFGYFVIIFLTLFLSGIADLGGYRKRFMQMFTLIGALSCMGLFGFNGENIGLGIGLPALAVIGFAGSLVYYNSFLPLIATPDRQDRISARGFSFGYAGSMLLLIFNLFSIEKYELFGFSGKLEAIKYAFVEVGIWWLAISQFAFYYLREDSRKIKLDTKILTRGFKEVIHVFSYIKQHQAMYRFLLAFFFFSMGVQTIIIIASLFGSAELGITGSKLIITILIIQIVAILGAILFAKVSTKYGNKTSLLWMLSIWIFVCASAYLIQNEYQFYGLGALVGLVMGGIQSQARSTWSKLIPSGAADTASYFTFYDSTEKLAIVFGMLGFGIIEQITGSMRNSALLLSSFFMVSLLIIAFTRLKKE